jgi:predicted TIM-barrel fold metal-dependent hydrolase
MADRTAESGGRLRWSLRAPLRTMDRAFEEMEFGKEHGATGIQVQGQIHGMVVDDEYLDPFYAKAQDLDLVVNFHVGLDTTISQRDARNNLPGITQVVVAFHRLAVSDLAERFPRVRWAFVEAGASWLPFALTEAGRGTEIMLRRLDDHTGIEQGLLERKNLYVGTQLDDDIPYLLDYSGEDNLIVGTDYGHLDIGADMEALEVIAQRDDVKDDVARKIVDENGRRLHGIDPAFRPSDAVVLTG